MATTNPALYYQPSGKTTLSGLVTLLIGGIAAIWILGIAYTYAVGFIPFIYINFIVTGAFGILAGISFSLFVKKGNLRAPGKVTLLTAIATLIGLYLHWAFFCAYLLHRASDIPLWEAYQSYLFSPSKIIDTAKYLLDNGHFSIGRRGRNTPVTGGFLALIWLVEALIILGGSLLLPRVKSQEPYSENLNRWADAEELPGRMSHFEDVVATKNALEAGNITPLLNTEPTDEKASHSKIVLYSAEGDSNCYFLSLKNVTVKINKKGKEESSTDTVVEYLRITPAQYQELSKKFGS
ncbi:MAG: hypothetical protein LBG78_07675 [Azoarcus sp.]|jgi:hypothetical protein|nr:hypothetical protein [Azoarcus sp.]